MSPRWLKFLEKFGRRGRSLPPMIDPEDLEGDEVNPQVLGRYDVLFGLFGPIPGSVWEPYQCPTLFASIDKCNIRPSEVTPSKGYRREHPPDAWQWIDPGTMVVVDLPGPLTIEVGVTMLQATPVQFVSTFDHWATPRRGSSVDIAVESEVLIDLMFTLAPEVYKRRSQLTPDSPPVWLCDNRRLGDAIGSPSPGTFDNRYYIDDSILPGVDTLKEGGIRRVVHIRDKPDDDPLPDLVPFLKEAKQAGIDLDKVVLRNEETWVRPQILKKLPFETDLPTRGFRRTDMGGFGKMVPEPSEGSYSSGGVGG